MTLSNVDINRSKCTTPDITNHLLNALPEYLDMVWLCPLQYVKTWHKKILDELVELCTMRIVGIARMGIHFGEGKYLSPHPPPPPNQKIYIPSLHCYLWNKSAQVWLQQPDWSDMVQGNWENCKQVDRIITTKIISNWRQVRFTTYKQWMSTMLHSGSRSSSRMFHYIVNWKSQGNLTEWNGMLKIREKIQFQC